VRAAFAYKRLSKSDRAAALGVSERQVTRIEAGEVAVNLDRLEAIAQATGVPLSFLREGFTEDEPALGERVEALEHQLLALQPNEARRLVAEAVGGLAEQVAQLQRELEALRAEDRRQRRAPGSGR
jgi:transcriptional regulator with XRE-family HTH domain